MASRLLRLGVRVRHRIYIHFLNEFLAVGMIFNPKQRCRSAWCFPFSSVSTHLPAQPRDSGAGKVRCSPDQRASGSDVQARNNIVGGHWIWCCRVSPYIAVLSAAPSDVSHDDCWAQLTGRSPMFPLWYLGDVAAAPVIGVSPDGAFVKAGVGHCSRRIDSTSLSRTWGMSQEKRQEYRCSTGRESKRHRFDDFFESGTTHPESSRMENNRLNIPSRMEGSSCIMKKLTRSHVSIPHKPEFARSPTWPDSHRRE